MKNILIGVLNSIILVFLFSNLGISQRNVVFVHGFNSAGGTWTAYNSWLQTNAGSNVSAQPLQDYDSYDGIQNFANEVITKNTSAMQSGNNIMIAHSTGGLVLRNLDLDGRFGQTGEHGIVTVGAPLNGAHIANAFNDGSVRDLVTVSTVELAAGPLINLFGIPGGSGLYYVIGFFGADFTVFELPIYVQRALASKLGVDKGAKTVIDLEENSKFLQIDAQKNTTSTHKVSIYGVVQSPEVFRFVGSSMWQNNEHGYLDTDLSPANDADAFVSQIDAVKGVYASAASANFWSGTANLIFSFFDFGATSPLTAYYYAAAAGWELGYYALDDGINRSYLGLVDANNWQQACYTYQTLTCPYSYYFGTCYNSNLGNADAFHACQAQCWQNTQYCIVSPANSVSDGFIKGNSAIGYNNPTWNPGKIYMADDINHNEETNNEKMTPVWNQIFFQDFSYFKLKQ